MPAKKASGNNSTTETNPCLRIHEQATGTLLIGITILLKYHNFFCFNSGQIDLIDMRHLPDDGNFWIMHATDHWSKFNFAYAIRSKHATCVAECLGQHIFPYFGVPRILHSDNGREFINQIIHQLLESWHANIQLVSGRPCHPQSQGVIERAHATLQRKLSAEISTSGEKSPPWSKWLPRIICKSH